MSYWSNIQASWISWGADWKNLWIPNYKWLYTRYFITDYVLSWYLKAKYFFDDKCNWTFMYYYDFYFLKTYDKTFMFLRKYNIDFSRLSQVGYVGKMLTLWLSLAWRYTTDFNFLTTWPQNLASFSANPALYYYYYLMRYMNNEVTVFDLYPDEILKFHEDDVSILQTFSASLFLSTYIFSTKTNMFDTDNFYEISYFNFWFNSTNISPLEGTAVKPIYIWKDKFWLANFLFNPMILNKYPNFTFFYNTWLHKSWQLSKKWILNSLKLYEVSYNYAFPVYYGVNYFFSKYVWFFFVMWEINSVFNRDEDLGVGISHEFIQWQLFLLRLKLSLRDTMVFRIKEVWFYLKAYLRYFGYEGWANLTRSRVLFKWLFAFKRLIWSSCFGYTISVGALLGFLRNFYFYFFNRWVLKSLIKKTYWKPKFLFCWYLYVSKSFLWAIFFLKKIIRIWKISVFLKFKIIHFFTNFLTHKLLKRKILFGSVTARSEFVGLDMDFKNSPVNFNGLIVFFLMFFRFSLSWPWKQKYALELNPVDFIITAGRQIIKAWERIKLVSYFNRYYDVKQSVKHSDWFAIIAFHPSLIINYVYYTYHWWLVWKKNFIYFYFALSHLTPKLFFWIVNDMVNLPHLSLLVHLVTIYWQNFFFFYLYVLKCLKKMYTHCSQEQLLFLTRPLPMFMQRSRSYITLLDLFSRSFKNFFSLGLFCININMTTLGQRPAFTLSDFASKLVEFGKPNCYLQNLENTFLFLNKFTYTEQLSESPFFMPFISFWIADKAFFKKNGWFFFERKNWLDVHQPYFVNRVPTHLIFDHFSNLFLNATLIAVFVKKKLEREHLLAEVMWSLTILVGQAEPIKGFMFLLKGWFSWKERATKVWLKRGKLNQVNIWTRLDYYKTPVTLKYGSASVWIWLLLENNYNELRAAI